MADKKTWQRVLFIGDSLTRGYDVPYGKGWVELLQAHFEKNITANGGSKPMLVNAGVDGATLQAIYNNLERALHEASYDAVVIMGGTNDILHGRNAEDCYFSLMRSVHHIQKADSDVIIGLAPQIDCDPDGDDAVLVDYNERLRTYCEEQGLLYIDFYKKIAEADYRGEILYAGDVHPNELGYHYMYEAACDVLKSGFGGM